MADYAGIPPDILAAINNGSLAKTPSEALQGSAPALAKPTPSAPRAMPAQATPSAPRAMPAQATPPPAADPFQAYLDEGNKLTTPTGDTIDSGGLTQRIAQNPGLAATGGMTAHEIASFHSQQAIADKNAQGIPVSIDDAAKFYNDMYDKALGAQHDVHQAVLKSQLEVEAAQKKAPTEIATAKQEAMDKANIDVAADQQKKMATRPLETSELDQIKNTSLAMDGLNQYRQAFQSAWNNKYMSGMGIVGAVQRAGRDVASEIPGIGGALAGFMGGDAADEFAPPDKKALETAKDLFLTHLATGIVGDTSGAGGRATTQALMEKTLPNSADVPESANAKFDIIYNALASQAKSFLQSRGGVITKDSNGYPSMTSVKNAAGLPPVDLSIAEPSLLKMTGYPNIAPDGTPLKPTDVDPYRINRTDTSKVFTLQDRSTATPNNPSGTASGGQPPVSPATASILAAQASKGVMAQRPGQASPTPSPTPAPQQVQATQQQMTRPQAATGISMDDIMKMFQGGGAN